MRKYWAYNDLATGFDELDNFFSGFFPHRSISCSFKGQLVDTDKYDLVLKKEYVEEEIKRKEEELRRLDELRKQAVQRYDSQKNEIEGEIKKLRKRLSP
jgi:hypothetical protein